MELLNRILSLLPSKKWCGCDNTVDEDSSYKFRVRESPDNGHLLQIRRARVCNACGSSKTDTFIETDCTYIPDEQVHELRVATGSSKEEMMKLLIEMRLIDALKMDVSDS